MISFLQPLALLGLFAAAIPPLLHLISRRMPPVIPFPALRYLTETRRKHSRRLKLRNLLLLILRTLVIILIVLAASRPIAQLPFGDSHAPTAIALVLDNSLSSGAVVGGTRILDRLVERAGHVLDRANSGDPLWLVVADAVPKRITVPEARLFLDTLGPWPVFLDLTEAVRAGRQALDGEPNLAHELIVVSDLLQNVPAYSHYRTNPNYEEFRGSPYGLSVLPSLEGVEVELVYLPNRTAATRQGSKHLSFWRQYLSDAGASSVALSLQGLLP